MMALTPRSMRSPVSPCDSQSKTSLHVRAPYYPPTPQPEPSQGTPETNRGLGLLGCNFPQQHGTVHGLPPSPQPLDAWSRHPMTEPFRQPPDISSAEYDPFSGFSTASSTGMLSTSSPDPPGLVYCQTPQSMQLPSHRSSISSSCSPIDAFSQHGSEYLCTPRVKIEEARNWYPSAGSLLRKSPTSQDLGTYSTVVSPISASEDGIYKPIHAATWPRADTTAYPATLQASSESQPSLFPPASILPSVERTKKKRQPTTPEEATHECRICGKLFKRSYNWKSHLETHNPDRKYPHPCTFTNGNTQCTKRFQRKTDLDRHYDSVHLKARNHECQLCGNRFARRDTLRRHTEDGCPKRLELGFRGGCAAPRWQFDHHTPRSRAFGLMDAQPPLVDTSHAPPPSVFPPFGHSPFGGGPPAQTPVYAR